MGACVEKRVQRVHDSIPRWHGMRYILCEDINIRYSPLKQQLQLSSDLVLEPFLLLDLNNTRGMSAVESFFVVSVHKQT